MKTYFTLAALLISLTFAYTQDINETTNYEIQIDWDDEQNKTHKYKKVYQKKDSDYIRWVYTTSKKVDSLIASGEEAEKYYHDGKGNAPINFTIRENGVHRIETYKNVIKPSKRTKGNTSIYIPEYTKPEIKGKLPKGIMTYFSDSSKGYEMGIKIDEVNRKVKIEILSTENELIQIIEDETLTSGWHNYKWDVSEIKPDVYILKYTVDDSEMTQIINIEGRGISLLNKFIDWLF